MPQYRFTPTDYDLFRHGPMMDVTIYAGHTAGAASLNTRAMFDTGADCSAISRSVIAKLRLQSTGTQKVRGAVGEERDSGLYRVRVALSPECFFNLTCTEIDPRTDKPCLLGREVLRYGELHYHGSEGRWEVVFDLPDDWTGGME